ncbi:MAG: MopE-related protein [Pseudomonadota bacterium]
MLRFLPSLALAVSLLPATASAGVVSWVDWQSYDTASATVLGQAIAADGTVVDVTYTGEWAFVQTSCGTNYWSTTDTGTYLSSTVDNAPDDSGVSATMCDIIALRYATSKTLTFSEPVTNPLFAVVSLNGNGYRFDRDFDILSYGRGYWGTGTLTETTAIASDGSVLYQLNGSGEPHGVIQFIGTFTEVSWTSLTPENWNGFGIAIENVAAAVPPEIDLFEADGTAILDEQATAIDFGTVVVGDSANLTFTIANSGSGPLNFTDLRIEGSGAAAYTVTTLAPAIAAGATTTFTVTFAPTDSVTCDAEVVIDSDDSDEAEFSFPITGAGMYDADGDGIADSVDNCPTTANPDQADTDADGTGDACDTCIDVDGDGFGVSSDGSCDADCDDTAAATYPGADEYCDGIDTDCDGTLDEDDALDAATWYQDADGDGYGDSAISAIACVAPSGYVADAGDCDDTAAATWPGADEYCDGVDTDCDGTSDEDDALDAATWYQDADGDGYGDAAASADACAAPSGYVADAGDCDDTAAATFPGADEHCDGTDTDCDGILDEDDALDASTWFRDGDGDGYGDPGMGTAACAPPSGYTADASDCDDGDAGINPAASEIWYDGIDSDCDGASDYDADGDGFDSAEYEGEDCDDGDPEVNPEAEDAWYDGVDSDCDGASDYDADGDGFDSETYGGDDCDDADPDTWPGAPDEPYDGEITDCDHASDYDADGDGFDAEAFGGEDCDDANSAIHPGATEIWYDGVDDDCDGNDDDRDEDGWPVDEDCDDLDPDSWPGGPGLDEDCQPVVPDDSGDTGEGGALKGGGGCACDGGAGFASLWLLGLVPVALHRRRRS